MLYPFSKRYDVVLNASQPGGRNYWMKISEFRGRALNQGLAIIRYSGAPESNPTMSPSGVRDGVIYQAWNTPASADVITVNELVAIGKRARISRIINLSLIQSSNKACVKISMRIGNALLPLLSYCNVD